MKKASGQRPADNRQLTTDNSSLSKEVAQQLAMWRDKIDAIDEQLLRLLNERAGCVIEIGKRKRAHSLPIYDPKREAEVVAHVQARNRGPLEPKAVARLFERIIDESRRVERLATDNTAKKEQK